MRPKPPNAGKGRKKGVPNRATADVRAAIALLAESCAPKLIEWLEQIEDPEKRLNCYTRLIEYHIPKLGRLEHTGGDGGPLTVEVVRFGTG